ncbi:MAG: chloride channel protein, partial [Clostridia bacterium]|nr:chloride channel protein [Clostridia bacterium]
FGLISVYEMGNGHSIIESLGTNGGVNAFSLSLNFASPLIVSLVVVLVMKFIASVLNMGASVPCGVFIPMLSVGACAGGLISYVASTCGMNPAYSDIIVMICMATFFATIVKAPLTSIVMVFELTGSYNFTLLLPVMLGVAIGYFIGRLCSTHAIYDVILEGFIESDGVAKKGIKERFVMTVESASPADGSEVHDLLLPWATAIIAIKRDGRDNISPSAETILNVGDELTIEAETDDREATEKELLAVTSGEE